ncbi:predicted protein [Sclerotinia sclerotiorum 1980 UF-70]|uniref:Transmembrane protein n=1 Tax=Sclerotinia sclerotiorum (strain ATCC 18683 / 1980 / Ss-1) TaxID=665079 RepID=A7EI78_SCLS1|nr:predicted protein [Sclerotinia sclerotiorum 1980 UF-70]EDO02544.1 predicted protein [Sclerotinia sclerotiorum 1980 UF-70]
MNMCISLVKSCIAHSLYYWALGYYVVLFFREVAMVGLIVCQRRVLEIGNFNTLKFVAVEEAAVVVQIAVGDNVMEDNNDNIE